MKRLLAALIGLVAAAVPAQTIEPLQEYRLQPVVLRATDGDILRSWRVTAAFKRIHTCPSTGLREGTCPGWYMDHVIPLACGGIDAVANLQWLDATTKALKDGFERRIYGGRGISPGCP